MALQSDKDAPGAGASAGPALRNVALLADRAGGADLLGIEASLRPLAELCLAPEAETPFALALIGGRGVGKRFAARTLIESIVAQASVAGQKAKAVVARVDAANAGDDPVSALAAATHAALEAADYTQLADEAAHATVDPRRAADAAAERHDEALRRLDEERRARDEVEGRRARLAEALLFETPGGRVDSFVRARRGRIEARLRSFGFVGGDAGLNFRHLVRDVSGLGGFSRLMLFPRALFAYRGQFLLLLLAALAFALAFGLDRLAREGGGEALRGMAPQAGTALDWLQAHGAETHDAVLALIGLGALAILANIWRALRFTGLLFSGLRLLELDIRERRGELDASAARLERRVAALQLEADTARQRAEALARRAGAGAGPAIRPPGPAFVGEETPARAAREFLQALARIVAAQTVPAPSRLLLSLENLDRAPAAQARQLIEAAVRLGARGAVVIAAFDPARLGAEGRDIAASLFDVVCDVGALVVLDGPALTTRLLTGAAPASAPAAARAKLMAPLEDSEARALASAGGLIGPNPRGLKRLLNAYRLARVEDAPRGFLALALAARLSGDPDARAALGHALEGEGEIVAPTHPPALAQAFSAVATGVDKAAARRAWALAQRYAP